MACAEVVFAMTIGAGVTERQGKDPRVRAVFCDLLNLPRGKYVPAALANGGSIDAIRDYYLPFI